MQLSITTNAKLVSMGLQNLAREIPRIGRGQIWKTMQRVRTRARIYPPERPLQKYVRTFRLRDNWKISKASTAENGYTISNTTPYTKYVMGSAYGTEQAWMHVGRWTPTRDIMEEELALLPAEIVSEINMVARREGLK